MIDIFDWVKDIEETYRFLIDNANNELSKEIRDFESEKKKILEVSLNSKQSIIDNALSTLLEECNNGTEIYSERFLEAISKIKDRFEVLNKKLIESITKELGIDF